MARRVLGIGVALLVVLLVAVGVSGHFLFTEAADDELQPADAVVVLGGEHDGREAYGIQLAEQIGASAVLLSNPYGADDPLMMELCGSRPAGIEIICFSPEPSTTRGEAMMTRQIGRERGWQRIAVVTWRYHLFRSRIIFENCYSDEPGRTTMHAVPIEYDLPVALWEYVYVYQYAGLVKNAVQGSCSSPS